MTFGPKSKAPKTSRVIESDYIHANQTNLVQIGHNFSQEDVNLSLSFSNFSLPCTPSFFSSPRIDKIALAFPLKKGNIPKNFLSISNIPTTSSFIGNTCDSCHHKGGRHGLYGSNEGRKIFVLGDSFVPPFIGGLNNCIPTLRVSEGSFAQVKAVLVAQLHHGLTVNPGSYFVVGLLSHLCQVGNSAFWDDFAQFESWASKTLGVIVIPFLPIFPKGLGQANLATIDQCINTMKGKFMGEGRAQNLVFSLWKPLLLALNSFEVGKINILVPPVRVSNRVIMCGGEVWEGFPGDFSKGCPTPYEKFFLQSFFSQLKVIDQNLHPSPLPLSFPDLLSLDSSLEGGILSENSKKDATTRDSFILLGSSILKEVGGALSPLAAKISMDVINLSVGGRVMDKVNVKNLPGAWKLGDILVVHPFGNYSLGISNFFFSNNKWHLTHPKYLSDTEISDLIEKTASFLDPICNSFKGRTFLLAPFPRLLSPCCNDPTHAIQHPSLKMTPSHYYILLGRYLQLHPQLRFQNSEFITYPALLPRPFTADCLRDGIHLTASSSAHLANCIRQLAIRNSSQCPPLQHPVPSFSSWINDLMSNNSGNAKVTDVTTSADPPSNDSPITAITSATDNIENQLVNSEDDMDLENSTSPVYNEETDEFLALLQRIEQDCLIE